MPECRQCNGTGARRDTSISCVICDGWGRVLDDEERHAVEWRTRLTIAVGTRAHDDEVLVDLLHAGLEQAYSEGVLAAAAICKDVAAGNPAASRIAGTLVRAIREYDLMNRTRRNEKGPTTSSSATVRG